jgi:hypothetical protein
MDEYTLFKLLHNYLVEGRFTDVRLERLALERFGLQIFSTSDTFGMSDDEIKLRRLLASEGAQIIIPVLRETLRIIMVEGQQLSRVLSKTAELSATLGVKEAARQNFQDEMDAGAPIVAIFMGLGFLIHEIALSTPQEGKMAGRQLALALVDTDPRMRILAALHSVTAGIPAETVSDTLINLQHNERDQMTRYAIASALIGLSVEPPIDIAETALQEMYDFLHRCAFGNFPALVKMVRDALMKNEIEGRQNNFIARVAIHHTLVVDRSFM